MNQERTIRRLENALASANMALATETALRKKAQLECAQAIYDLERVQAELEAWNLR